MNEASIVEYITRTFDRVEVVKAQGNYFLFNDPAQMFPFVTVVSNDEYDSYSDLNREGVFRLNIGVSKESFRSMFPKDSQGKVENKKYDYTVANQFMPHPEYGMMYWISILNPDDEKFRVEIKPLIAEAYEISDKRYGKRTKKV